MSTVTLTKELIKNHLHLDKIIFEKIYEIISKYRRTHSIPEFLYIEKIIQYDNDDYFDVEVYKLNDHKNKFYERTLTFPYFLLNVNGNSIYNYFHHQKNVKVELDILKKEKQKIEQKIEELEKSYLNNQ